MNQPPNLNQYWGVRISCIRQDCFAMSVAFDLYWTDDTNRYQASLDFVGVYKFEIVGETIFDSEVVELISLEKIKVAEGWRIVGELSNYEFTIVCAEIVEARSVTQEL